MTCYRPLRYRCNPNTSETNIDYQPHSSRWHRYQRRTADEQSRPHLQQPYTNAIAQQRHDHTPQHTTQQHTLATHDHTKLPTLSYNIFKFCRSAATIHASLLDAEDIITQVTLTHPIDPAQLAAHKTKVNTLKALTMHSIPEAIATRLSADFLHLSPLQILNTIQAHIAANNNQNHALLGSASPQHLLSPWHNNRGTRITS